MARKSFPNCSAQSNIIPQLFQQPSTGRTNGLEATASDRYLRSTEHGVLGNTFELIFIPTPKTVVKLQLCRLHSVHSCMRRALTATRQQQTSRIFTYVPSLTLSSFPSMERELGAAPTRRPSNSRGWKMGKIFPSKRKFPTINNTLSANALHNARFSAAERSCPFFSARFLREVRKVLLLLLLHELFNFGQMASTICPCVRVGVCVCLCALRHVHHMRFP